MPVEGGQARQLTWHAGTEFPSGWSPDGKHLLFSGKRDSPNYAIYALDVKSLRSEVLCEDYAQMHRPSFSPDGNSIAFVGMDANNNIDIYVANDGQPNLLWINQRDGTFRNLGLLSGAAVNEHGRPEASMGVDAGDYDNDGDDDLYVVNGMNEYAVYSSVNPYLLENKSQFGGGILPVAEKEVPVFFVNTNGTLQEETAKSGAAPAGNARSVAYFDADADGDLDMVVNNFSTPAIVYRNNANGNHWLKLRLVGDPAKGVTRDAIGAGGRHFP